MSMKSCGVCTREVRKTTMAYVMTAEGIKRKRTCAACVQSRGFTVIASDLAPKCKCGKPATRCSDHGTNTDSSDEVRRAVKALRSLVKVVRATKPADREIITAGLVDARVEGLETAIELLESGRW